MSSAASGVTSPSEWVLDHCGNERFPPALHRLKEAQVRATGLPCVLRYVERSSGLACLELDPLPGWVHFSSSRCVQKCLASGGKCHICLAFTKSWVWKNGGWVTFARAGLADPLSNPNVALKRIRDVYVQPREVVLWIHGVSEWNSVARVSFYDPTTRGELAAMVLPRRVFGGHDEPDLTISM